MTATQIIDEIKALPPDEFAVVEEFVEERASVARQLPGEELGRMARQMVNEEDPKRKAQIRAEIIKGFYGDE